MILLFNIAYWEIFALDKFTNLQAIHKFKECLLFQKVLYKFCISSKGFVLLV